MNKILKNRLFLSLLGGSLLSLAWLENSSGLIMFIALLPFLYILEISKNRTCSASFLFSILFPGFLLFNILTFSWLGKVSFAGGSMAIIAHSILLSLVFRLAWSISLKSGRIVYYLSLVSFWMAYEFACLNIDIISPWLNSGNVFGKEVRLIQWYEFTGSGGGSLWIILVNILVFNAIIKYKDLRKQLKNMISPALLIILPILLSFLLLGNSYKDKLSTKILLIQPNIDPYNEKFDSIAFIDQFNSMLKMAKSALDNNTDWLIMPETAIDDPFYEVEGTENKYIQRAYDFLNNYDDLNILFGATTLGSVKDSENINTELYNTAIHLAKNSDPDYYHKSKLVPGIENNISILPPFLERIIIPQLGGSMSGYTCQEERDIFRHSTLKNTVAPIICYESAYGEFCTSYVRQGATILAVITNDGWWNNTPAYKQHLWFASLRAIENRRPLVRSANTGISCIIDSRGIIKAKTDWWTENILLGTVYGSDNLTFYSRHGDYIYRIFTFSAVIILLLAFLAAPIRNLHIQKKI